MAVICVGIWTPWWMATKRAGEGYTARINGGEKKAVSAADGVVGVAVVPRVGLATSTYQTSADVSSSAPFQARPSHIATRSGASSTRSNT